MDTSTIPITIDSEEENPEETTIEEPVERGTDRTGDTASAPAEVSQTNSSQRAQPRSNEAEESPLPSEHVFPVPNAPAVSTAPATSQENAFSSQIDFQKPFAGPGKRSTEERDSGPISDDDEGEEATTCSICFEPWASRGEHRVVSLKCGHLFGRSCIERWLGKSGKPREAKSKCPECKAFVPSQVATKKDIRVIWAKRIVAIDTLEKDQALREAREERALREQADMKIARLQLAYQMATAELDKVHEELGRIRQEYNRCRQQLGVMKSKYEAGPSLWSCSPQGKYIGVDTVPISLDLLISRSLGARSSLDHHGLLRLNMRELSQQEFIPIHSKAVRDAHCSPLDNNLVLTTSLDKTMKLVSLTTNSVVQSFDLGAAGWSCCWNSSDGNYVYSGQSNNSIRMFDLRYTKDPVKHFQDRAKLGMKPIHSLVHVPQDGNPGKLLAANLEHVFTWENLVNIEAPSVESSCRVLDLQLPGSSCYSVSYDSSSSHMLTSFRNVGQSSTHHIVSRIENTAEDFNVKHVCHLDGRSGQTSLGKTTIFTRSYGRNSAQPTTFVCAGDEASSSLLLWDIANSQYVFQELASGSRDTFLDMKRVSLMGKDDMLVGLTDKMLHLFKWIAT
ncbi:hypothetical protein K493DRAFT_382177 [Basidiobolus meristosporus CBS 931.73]|uniref:RING-type E3 ubiquitin transferase n=1 Tax=Basidiobolus meristosporus CBS 931.73 TaxID=1314790 RepID=A0A1Y1XVL7_9FUNG|nr:hypothetical protein K493DRAFT_382177 [Basidiobolus meristosporus CBS 931.73]|eukprot:ORX89763.1 hypothetical protein K493DRAFT_382177 [Basidiobolus meristosporus CBS 931.73]